jgi:hypothetical protein
MDMDLELYIVDVNVIPAEDSEILEQFPDAKGALLTCFVKAEDALVAGINVKSALEEDRYTVLKIEEIVLEDSYDENEWEPEIKEIIDEAKNDKAAEVYYGPFYCYEED